MEGQNFLSLKFQNKNAILFKSLNQLCFSENLCDVKFVANDGEVIFMHKLVLLQAFPYLKYILDRQSDQIVVIVPDTPAHGIEVCREALYKAGNENPLKILLGFENVANFAKFGNEDEAVKQEDEAYNTDDYVDMDVLQDYVEVDSLQKTHFPQNYEAYSERKNNFDTFKAKDGVEIEFKEKKLKKSSISTPVISNVPFYFLLTAKTQRRTQGSQGALITHDSFKFTRNNVSRDFMREWFQCVKKNSPWRCQASAITRSVDGGKTYFLSTCSKPEEHTHTHDKVSISKERLLCDIKTMVKKSPTTAKVNYEKARDMVLEEASKTYLNDPEIFKEVVALIKDPEFNLNRRMNYFKQQVVAKINKELSDSAFSFNQI